MAAADVARTLWLTREQIWFKLSQPEREQITAWLLQAKPELITTRNNWLLFPVVVHAFLKSVGAKADPDYRSYWEFKNSSYRTNGWFTDGPGGPVDFYNAWGISYDLFWLHQMDPALDHAFIENALRQSAELTAHLVSPNGIPIMGRSVCYRTAVPSPMIAASLLFPGTANNGMNRRALDRTWRYFVGKGALQSGALTMGYYGNDQRLVDTYSGPGSCHWGLRSLTLAFMARPDHPFWTAAQQPLPVERGDYRIKLPELGWSIVGRQADGAIEIRRGKGLRTASLNHQTLRERLREIFYQRPSRSQNKTVKYELERYSSVTPLGGTITK